jgi:hypothetical protein
MADISGLSRFETWSGIALGSVVWRLVVNPLMDDPHVALPPLLFALFLLVSLFVYHTFFASQFVGVVLYEDVCVGTPPDGMKRVFVKSVVSTLLVVKREFWIGFIIGLGAVRTLLTPLLTRPSEVWEVSAFYIGVIVLLSVHKALKKSPLVFPVVGTPPQKTGRSRSSRARVMSVSVPSVSVPSATLSLPVPASKKEE